MTDAPFTWLITGASSGFGRAIAEHALENGDAVVAAVRRPDSMADLTERYPERIEVVHLDASRAGRSGDAATIVTAATERFGRLDVLVNNAGRGIIGAGEEIEDAEFRDAMELHLFTPVALTRAALPVMRAQRSGTIVQMSSQGGRLSFPGVGGYSAGKFALEGWSEAVAGEVAPYGIRMLIVEPSRFRTSFNTDGALAEAQVSDAYRDILAEVRDGMRSGDGVQEGDPDRAAQVIVRLAHAESADDVPLRLAMGHEAVQRIGDAYRSGLAELEAWAETSRGTDFPAVR